MYFFFVRLAISHKISNDLFKVHNTDIHCNVNECFLFFLIQQNNSNTKITCGI